MAKGVVIGSKFTGPNASANTQTGEYWHVLPPLTGTDLQIQKRLLVADKLATAREKVNALPRDLIPREGATGTAVSVSSKKEVQS